MCCPGEYLTRQQHKVVNGLLNSAALHCTLNEVGKGCVGEGQRQLWSHGLKQLQVLLVLVLEWPQLEGGDTDHPRTAICTHYSAPSHPL